MFLASSLASRLGRQPKRPHHIAASPLNVIATVLARDGDWPVAQKGYTSTPCSQPTTVASIRSTFTGMLTSSACTPSIEPQATSSTLCAAATSSSLKPEVLPVPGEQGHRRTRFHHTAACSQNRLLEIHRRQHMLGTLRRSDRTLSATQDSPVISLRYHRHLAPKTSACARAVPRQPS